MKDYRLAIGTALISLVLSVSSFAAANDKERVLGTFSGWHAYAYDEGGQTVCYMVTTKTIKSTPLKKRQTPYLMITHRPIEASTDVISYGAGVMLNTKRDVKMHIGKSDFDLFSVKDTAWTRDAQTDHKLARTLTNAPSLQVVSYPSQKGSKALSDIFDLTGASSAYKAIGKACGLPEAEPKKPKKPTKAR